MGLQELVLPDSVPADVANFLGFSPDAAAEFDPNAVVVTAPQGMLALPLGHRRTSGPGEVGKGMFR